MGRKNALPLALGLVTLLSTLSLSAVPAQAAAQSPSVQVAQNASLGTILTGPNGMTLYVFTKDTPGTTNCYGQCAVNWPPLLLKAGELLNAAPGLGGQLSTTTRTDGTLQVTLNGAPLYYWIKDKAVGDTTGHKVGGVWFAAEPGLLLDTAGTWSQNQVSAAVRSGWIKGNPDGHFQPNGEMTRAEFTAALTQAFQTPSGGDPQAEPDRSITREEAIVQLVRALGLQGTADAQAPALERFSDANRLMAQNAPLVSIAVEHGLVQGYPDQTIRGEKPVSRAEAVVLITRALAIKK